MINRNAVPGTPVPAEKHTSTPREAHITGMPARLPKNSAIPAVAGPVPPPEPIAVADMNNRTNN